MLLQLSSITNQYIYSNSQNKQRALFIFKLLDENKTYGLDIGDIVKMFLTIIKLETFKIVTIIIYQIRLNIN